MKTFAGPHLLRLKLKRNMILLVKTMKHEIICDKAATHKRCVPPPRTVVLAFGDEFVALRTRVYYESTFDSKNFSVKKYE